MKKVVRSRARQTMVIMKYAKSQVFVLEVKAVRASLAAWSTYFMMLSIGIFSSRGMDMLAAI